MLNNCENLNPFGQLLIIIGTVLAVVICWGRTNSIWVAALAGLFGWLYVFIMPFLSVEMNNTLSNNMG